MQQKVLITLTKTGAEMYRSNQIAKIGHAGLGWSHSSAKIKLQSTTPTDFFKIESILPDWEGDLKERAAVSLGFRKKSSKLILSVEAI